MAAPRSASLRALKTLSAHSKQVVHVPSRRKLHMTGPATFPTPLLTPDRPAVNLPRDLAGLRAECQKRSLPVTGSKAELIQRLTAEDIGSSRAFSTAALDETTTRPSPTSPTSAPATRHFNTSRSLKAVGDTSTIDFAYLPDFDPDAGNGPLEPIRVPLLPPAFNSYYGAGAAATSYAATEQAADADAAPLARRPEILTVAADSSAVHSPALGGFTSAAAAADAANLDDAGSVDFQGMADRIKRWQQQPATDEAAGMVREIWSGLMEDLFGGKKAGAGQK